MSDMGWEIRRAVVEARERLQQDHRETGRLAADGDLNGYLRGPRPGALGIDWILIGESARVGFDSLREGVIVGVDFDTTNSHDRTAVDALLGRSVGDGLAAAGISVPDTSAVRRLGRLALLDRLATMSPWTHDPRLLALEAAGLGTGLPDAIGLADRMKDERRRSREVAQEIRTRGLDQAEGTAWEALRYCVAVVLGTERPPVPFAWEVAGRQMGEGLIEEIEDHLRHTPTLRAVSPGIRSGQAQHGTVIFIDAQFERGNEFLKPAIVDPAPGSVAVSLVDHSDGWAELEFTAKPASTLLGNPVDPPRGHNQQPRERARSVFAVAYDELGVVESFVPFRRDGRRLHAMVRAPASSVLRDGELLPERVGVTSDPTQPPIDNPQGPMIRSAARADHYEATGDVDRAVEEWIVHLNACLEVGDDRWTAMAVALVVRALRRCDDRGPIGVVASSLSQVGVDLLEGPTPYASEQTPPGVRSDFENGTVDSVLDSEPRHPVLSELGLDVSDYFPEEGDE